MDPATRDARMEYAQKLVPSIIAALTSSGATREDAEDAAETMVERSPKCDATNPKSFRAWSNRTARNALIDLYRARERAEAAWRLVATERIVETNPGEVVTEEVYRRGKARATMRAILRLPLRQRDALLLSVEGATVQQIADKQHTSYKAAEHIVARARRAVQEGVKATYGGLVALARPRLVAVAASVVAVLAGLALLVHVRPVPPVTAVDAPPLHAAPPIAARAVPERAMPHVRAASATPSASASRPLLPLPGRILPKPREIEPRRVRHANGMTLPEEVVYCVERLEVPDLPPAYLGCPPHE